MNRAGSLTILSTSNQDICDHVFIYNAAVENVIMGCIKQVHLKYQGKASTDNVYNDDIENRIETKDNTWN